LERHDVDTSPNGNRLPVRHSMQNKAGCYRPPVKAAQKNSARDSHPHYNKKRKFSKLQGVESFALLKASTAS